MGNLDIIIFIVYGVVIIAVGNWFARSKESERNSADYFFANKSLPWFLVGSSIIAANISAEQFIGMSGSGFVIGLGIATYEWIAALILIVVAKYFLPVFVEKKIFTMPQFLSLRYDNRIKTILAIFWLSLFVFVNLTSILYLGALALQSIFGIKLIYGILGLAVFSLVYTIVNGLKAIASTDIIQVFFLLVGGLITTYFVVNHVGENTGILNGFEALVTKIPDKFHMIIKKSDPNYFYLPGIRAIIGGIWIAGIYYFGANQYIIQKAFGTKSLREAQKGMVFAGYLKMILPFVSPKKWDAEHPNLYTVIATLYEDGKKIMVKSERIGFRKVVREGNKLLVNGKSVELRGACRHNIHPLLGRMTTPEYDKMDVLLAKESNMNFIRTSHYPPSEAFLDYCDEYGIYVEDETAVCFVRSSQSKPEFTERFLSQLEEMVQNHRNRPSIIIWSIGNENRFGDNFVKSFDWLKAEDVTRPIIYSYPGQVPDSLYVYDIISMHYPSWKGDREQFGLNIKGFSHESMPVLFDEWAHVACYNNFELKEDPNVRNFWGQSLDSMWTNLFETKGGLGGAIWCMLDETFMLPEDLEGFDEWWGIISSRIFPSIYEGHCVGFGEWGIVDTWRRKKPEFLGTKKAYSPTKIYTKQIDDFQKGKELQIPIHNRFDHTNFSELKIVWEYGTKSGELENVNIEPHSKGVLVFPANNWNSSEKFNIKFLQDDSFLVDEYNIQLGKREVDLPICKSGNLTVKKEKDIITVSGKEFALNVNMKTGLLENVQRNGETIIESGPFINFRLPGKAILHSTIEMDDYAKNWKLTNFNFVENNGIATINSKGTYDSISASFTIKVDETGVFNIDYNIEGAPKGKNIQEVGIKFQVGDAFKTLAWDRNSYFTAYPQSDLGSPVGRVDIPQRTEMNYRKKPNHGWELDMKGFYYFGLDKELPYTNIVRALKENIYTYSLITQSGSKLEVISDGVNACRFDKIEGDNTLIINSQWDYSNLLWGNYMKQIKSGGEFGGQVKFLTR